MLKDYECLKSCEPFIEGFAYRGKYPLSKCIRIIVISLLLCPPLILKSCRLIKIDVLDVFER